MTTPTKACGDTELTRTSNAPQTMETPDTDTLAEGQSSGKKKPYKHSLF